MNSNNKEYLDQYIYNYIDELAKSSEKYKELSENLKDRLSDLFESIEEEDCKEILDDIEELNKYLITLNKLSTNEFIMIKNNGIQLIEKYRKHKEKIFSLKSKNSILEEELNNANDQKDKALLKIDELNDEYYKLYQEKNNIEMQNNYKENEDNEKYKINNEILNDEIKELNNKIENFNLSIKILEERIRELSENNDKLTEDNTFKDKEIKHKSEVIESWIEKYEKTNEENENIRFLNTGLHKTIEILDNQCKDYETLIQQLKDQITNYERINYAKKITNNVNNISLFNDEEDNKSKNDNINENEGGTNSKKRNGVENTGMSINLNDLIFDQSENSESEFSAKKSSGLRFSLNKKKSGVNSSNFKYRKSSEESDNFKTPKKNALSKGFESLIKSKAGSHIILQLQNYTNNNENNNCKKVLSKNDEAFLTELLFRLLDC